MGKDVIGWRTADGRICIGDAMCPHLGANLSPETGGKVENDLLVCPFHGFCYDVSGTCIRGFTQAKAKCQIRTYPVHESNGFVFAYFDENALAPTWQLPNVDDVGWSKTLFHSFPSVRTHPQEISENAVDMLHFKQVHGFGSMDFDSDPSIEGPIFKSQFSGEMTHRIPFLRSIKVRTHTVISLFGLGYMMVDSHSPDFGLTSKIWLLITPTDGDRVHVASGVKVLLKEKGERKLGHLISRSLLQKFVPYIVQTEFIRTIHEDIDIWENKEYRPFPLLNTAERAILQYRNYCTQFYSDVLDPKVTLTTQ